MIISFSHHIPSLSISSLSFSVHFSSTFHSHTSLHTVYSPSSTTPPSNTTASFHHHHHPFVHHSSGTPNLHL
ncbi:hypothetical protein HanPSC8_Chr08g0333611 [Helianthus annuus]|nr:hypothetical protein HanPSC8_Chr08g0333611 [Helianthus annuus]